MILFTQHIRLFNSVGKMFHLAYCWYQMFCGTSYQLFGNSATTLHHHPIGWFHTLHSFLANTAITIELAQSLLRLLKPLQNGNMNLMEAFHILGWKGPKICLLNYCWLYLWVETLLELCDTNGSCTLPEAWQGKPLLSRSTLLWPSQGLPIFGHPGDRPFLNFFLHNPNSTYQNARQILLHNPSSTYRNAR